MSRLKYAEFYDEQMDVRGLGIPQVAAEIEKRFPAEFEQVHVLSACYEFMRGRGKPNALMASAWGQVFNVNLPPRYYTHGKGRKP